MAEKPNLKQRPDVVQPHEHSAGDLPVGVGPGKIAPGEAADPVTFQPTPVTVGPTQGAGVNAVIPEMTTGAFTAPALLPGSTAWRAKCKFSGTFSVDTVAEAGLVVLDVDGAPVLPTERTRSVAAGAIPGSWASLAFQWDVLLAPGVHTLSTQWRLTSAGPAVIANLGIERSFTVEIVPA